MSVFPDFSNISDYVRDELTLRRGNTTYVSSLNAWIRVSSGVDTGLMLYSNPDYNLLRAVGDKAASMYGNSTQSGTVGKTWDGKYIPTTDVILKPSPYISSFEVDEGGGTATLSRKASFKIVAHSKGQLDSICKYFLEPGFTVFIEWGWNKRDAYAGWQSTLNADYVSSFNSFKVLDSRRKICKGKYDNYLGFITGGSVSVNGTTWEVSVNCTGFPELPAYLMVSDSITPTSIKGKKTKDGIDIEADSAVEYAPSLITGEENLGKKRYMMMFNELPSSRRKASLQKKFEGIPDLNRAVNYINFDEAVQEEFNSSAGDNIWSLAASYVPFVDNTQEVKAEGQNLEIPDGTKVIGNEKFIRFGALMQIINSVGAKGYIIGKKQVTFTINSSKCICSAFDRMFSTDKTKLFIPNPHTPKFSLAEAINKTEPQTDFSQLQNNTVQYGKDAVTFPYTGNLVNGVITSGPKNTHQISYIDKGAKINGVSKKYTEFGFLDDLYVNFDFVKGIMDTKNFLMKDALYQILNGMASAAGSLWDFQIVESSSQSKAGENVELRIVDINFVSTEKDPLAGILRLPITGPESVFMDASLDLDISSGKMNQVIGSRLQVKTNSSSASTVGKLFANGYSDMVLNKIEQESVVGTNAAVKAGAEGAPTADKKEGDKPNTNTQGTKQEEEKGWIDSGLDFIAGAAQSFGNSTGLDSFKSDRGAAVEKENEANAAIEKAKEQNLQLFLDKVGIYPKVEYTKDNMSSRDGDLYNTVYVGALNDLTIFEGLKLGYENIKDVELNNTGAIMPIEFTFTVHGISGFKRGDKFIIDGLPSKYSTSGFFQVLSIKQSIENMTWKTEIKGGFRQVSIKTALANDAAKRAAANTKKKEEAVKNKK
jgi:hypothetical protein